MQSINWLDQLIRKAVEPVSPIEQEYPYTITAKLAFIYNNVHVPYSGNLSREIILANW